MKINKAKILLFIFSLCLISSLSAIFFATTVEHTHLLEKKYDEFYHWDQCSICNTIQNKATHSLTGNGGSKTLCENGYYDNAYREVCSCGYKSKPQVVLHGRYENFADSGVLNYGNMVGIKLSDIKQISYSEFLSINYPAAPGNQEYTWEDPDGDGYGWVFCGGPILNEYGAKSTLKIILGTTGDFGRGVEFDEVFKLTKYIDSDSTPTLTEFVNSLPSKSEIPSTHLLYGMKEKYQAITQEQWNLIVKNFSGYYTHTSSWGWSSMCIQHSGHANSGSYLYSNGACYDSSNNHSVSMEDGIKTDCDLCGAHYTGWEALTSNTWYVCYASRGVPMGHTITCSGHVVTGKYYKKLGTIYCTFTNNNGIISRTLKAVPESGYSVSLSGGNFTKNSDGSLISQVYTCKKVNAVNYNAYEYIYNCTFSNGLSGNDYIGRTIECGYSHPLTDETAPVAYGYTNNTTNNSYWNIIGNGTENNTSIQASATITFKDPQQYTYNQLTVRVYDSDKTTILLQGNGATNTNLVKVNGTSGDNTLWQGNINIVTEVYGSKNIYIQAIDSVGNKSELIPMQITYLDSTGPTISHQIDIPNTTWSKSKTITFYCTDQSGISYGGLSADDMINMSNNTPRKYTYTENLKDGKTIRFYAQDSSGNVSYKDVTINNIDNLAPVINEPIITISANTASIIVSATDSHSGITGYAITNTNEEPSEYQTSNKFTKNFNGKYYIWVKDLVGNVSSKEISINDIYSVLTLNLNGGKLNNSTSIQTINVIHGQTLNISNPEKIGHTFIGWDSNVNGVLNGNNYTAPSQNVTLTAKYSVNNYNVKLVDMLTDKTTQLGTQTAKSYEYGAEAKGSDWGTTSPYDNTQYTYNYNSSSSVTVSGETTVYRYWTRTVNKYNVTVIDMLTDKTTQLGTQTAKSYEYGAEAKGSDWGTTSPYNNAQYTYNYDSCTSTKVDGEETVYRYWTRAVNNYNVTLVDMLTDKTTQIGTQNAKGYDFGNTAKGSDWGTESPYDNVQYTYTYSDCTSVTVDGNETVYRYWTRTVNRYDVIYKDTVTNASGRVLGTKIESHDYGTEINPEDLGTDTTVGAYYTDYKYVGCSEPATVTENGAIVYRYFEYKTIQIGLDITVEEWHGEYDGQPHGITISSSIPNLKVMYGLQPEVYNLTSCPEFTNTGEYTVYYQISKEGYTPIEGSQTVKIVNKGANMVDVYATQASTFTVRIPKVIILDGKEGHGAYSIKVSGNIAGTDIITVTPESEFFMKQDGKEDIKTTVTQTGTDFSYANGVTETGTQTETGKIEMESISAGKWSGLFNFNITSSVDTKAEDSIGSVEEDILNETVIGQDTAQDKESEFDTLENEVKTAE